MGTGPKAGVTALVLTPQRCCCRRRDVAGRGPRQAPPVFVCGPATGAVITRDKGGLLLVDHSGDRLEVVAAGGIRGRRWSVDLLLVDADAIPVLMEAKGSSETRVRREVIGQLPDYAANAPSFWSAESLALDFEATRPEVGEDPDEALAAFLGTGWRRRDHGLHAASRSTCSRQLFMQC